MIKGIMTYPVPFRRHVLEDRERGGLTFKETGKRFFIGITSVVRWAGRFEPKPSERRKPHKLDPEKLAQDVQCDDHQYERTTRFDVLIHSAGPAQVGADAQEEILLASEGGRQCPTGLPRED